MALYNSYIDNNIADIQYVYGKGNDNIDITGYNRSNTAVAGNPFVFRTDDIYLAEAMKVNARWRPSNLCVDKSIDFSKLDKVSMAISFGNADPVLYTLDVSSVSGIGYFILEYMWNDAAWSASLFASKAKNNYSASGSSFYTRLNTFWSSTAATSPTVSVKEIILI